MRSKAMCLYLVGLASLLTSFLPACQQEVRSRTASLPGLPATTRPSVDALDKATADARKARVSDIEYDLDIVLEPDAPDFSGEVSIRFNLSAPDVGPEGALTLDFGGGTVLGVVLNGRAAEVPYNGYFLSLPPSGLHSGPNTISVRYRHPFSKDGTGLHHFVDPVDGLSYLYTYLWPYYANRLFPSFDQPNLKARISLTVHAPDDWIVISMAPGSPGPQAGDGTATWRFVTTPPMATYAFSLHAGPYHVWQADADGIPMRLLARQSLARFVAVDEWFEVSRRGLRYYETYFDIPYPFTKYDQLIVPDFAIGAMENIAAITFSEEYVQRQTSDRAQREDRASTILHEMAHMWFGDLVTHEWWNGLWLNESFATQMAAMAELQTTEFSDTWHGFFVEDKQKAYHADSRVSTHPIEVPVKSTSDFFSVFDAITYQKGSSVLKQLAHYVGEDNYRNGVSAYLKANAYGNTELEDFIAYQSQVSGKDLSAWSRDWLYQPGFNTLRAEPRCADGRLTALEILQSAPPEHPTLRSHRVDIGLYAPDDKGALLPATVLPAAIEGERTAVSWSGVLPCPALINPNHNDWTLAQIEPDGRSLETLDDRLSAVPEPLARSMFLAALHHRVMQGKAPLAGYLEQAMTLAEDEDNIRVQQQLSSSLIATVQLMRRLRPETDAALEHWLPLLEEQSLRHAGTATGSDLKRIWFNTFLGVASGQNGLAIMRELLDGTRQIPGLAMSADLRWMLLIRLARSGAPDIDALLAVEMAADDSDYGMKSALTARAAIPDPQRKAGWLAELRNPGRLTGLPAQRAVMAGMFPPGQERLHLGLLEEILRSLPELSYSVDPYFMSSYVSQLLQPICLPESVAMMRQTLDGHADELDSTALRFLREAQQADAECLSLRGVQ